MMDERTYKKEIVRMWDSIRDDEYKGTETCSGVTYCDECPLYNIGCGESSKAFEMIEAVEKWSSANPPTKKYKVSKTEYDILKSVSEYKDVLSITPNLLQFCHIRVLRNMLKKGYFEGANDYTNIDDYINLCEVVGDE